MGEHTELEGVAVIVKESCGEINLRREQYPQNCHASWTNNEKSVLLIFL